MGFRSPSRPYPAARLRRRDRRRDRLGQGARRLRAVNHLADETSPYLRQHRDNPVDWYPWGEEATALARSLDRPILLSVGYSACHWCHVMAHQSFEDDEVARAMNDQFVNIKVDREERPDVDAIYMEAVQAQTGSGGWPMTVFLTPDGRPFFGGTYFPKPVFLDLMTQVSAAWRDRRPDIERDADRLADAVRSGIRVTGITKLDPSAPSPLSPSLVRGGVDALRSAFDREWGGFGRAPKFPQASMVELALRGGANDVVTTTLDAMASGGIYDHVGGGFARYAVERRWLVPHFEKMLYDNAQLIGLYTHGWQVTGADRYRQVVEETVAYLLRPPMRSPAGGIHSAEDADSEGVEGKFYVWSEEEVSAVGGPAAVDWYGVTAEGNWEGHNILWRPERGDLLRPPEVEEARRKLFEARELRVRPGLDDKVVTEWNAMAVAALAEAGAAMDRTRLAGGRGRGCRVPPHVAATGRRALVAGLARRAGGPSSGLRHRLRMADPCLHPAGRGDRAGPLAGRGPGGGRRPGAAVLGRAGGRFLHHRRRRREADRAVQGHL